MKKTSLCIWLMAVLPVLIYGEQPQCSSRTTEDNYSTLSSKSKDINAAWIKVPWSHGSELIIIIL